MRLKKSNRVRPHAELRHWRLSFASIDPRPFRPLTRLLVPAFCYFDFASYHQGIFLASCWLDPLSPMARTIEPPANAFYVLFFLSFSIDSSTPERKGKVEVAECVARANEAKHRACEHRWWIESVTRVRPLFLAWNVSIRFSWTLSLKLVVPGSLRNVEEKYYEVGSIGFVFNFTV